MKALILALVVGCGGAITSPTEDGGVPDSSPAEDAAASGCPASPPANNGACSDDGLRCEYGTSPSPQCNQLFVCLNGGWVEQSQGGICPDPSQCPSSYASVPQGQDCSPDALACAYAEGTCFCSHGGGPPSPTDRWFCYAAEAGCPSPRPDMGTACSSPGQSCDYGSCAGGVALQCNGGVWTQEDTPCPL